MITRIGPYMKLWFLRHRKGIRRLFGLLVIALLIGINNLNENIQVLAGRYSGWVYAVILVITEFGPEILGYIQSKIGASDRIVFVETTINKFVEFLNYKFGIRVENRILLDINAPIITHLDDLLSYIPKNSFGNIPEQKRRVKILPLIFLIKYTEEIEPQEDLNVIIKIRYGDEFTERAIIEFTNIYANIIINDRFFQDNRTYFSGENDDEYEKSRLHFLDRYFKDDYIKEVTHKLNLSEQQTSSFKRSVEAIASSEKFTIRYLRKFIAGRKKYRKLFLITSKSGLPREIQSYIKQNPYFILNFTSIENLPVIGRSKGLNIFFFSPIRFITTAKEMFTELTKIAPSLKNHPLKIYEIDPFEGYGNKLIQDVNLFEALQYFEHFAFQANEFRDLNYQQIISVLEQGKVSLKEVISELPISEFSSSIKESEKEMINGILNEFIREDNDLNIFRVLGKNREINSKIKKLRKSDIVINYDPIDFEDLYGEKMLMPEARNRLLNLANEIYENISSLDKSLL